MLIHDQSDAGACPRFVPYWCGSRTGSILLWNREKCSFIRFGVQGCQKKAERV